VTRRLSKMLSRKGQGYDVKNVNEYLGIPRGVMGNGDCKLSNPRYWSAYSRSIGAVMLLQLRRGSMTRGASCQEHRGAGGDPLPFGKPHLPVASQVQINRRSILESDVGASSTIASGREGCIYCGSGGDVAKAESFEGQPSWEFLQRRRSWSAF
jgi:hypothetical protein